MSRRKSFRRTACRNLRQTDRLSGRICAMFKASRRMTARQAVACGRSFRPCPNRSAAHCLDTCASASGSGRLDVSDAPVGGPLSRARRRSSAACRQRALHRAPRRHSPHRSGAVHGAAPLSRAAPEGVPDVHMHVACGTVPWRRSRSTSRRRDQPAASSLRSRNPCTRSGKQAFGSFCSAESRTPRSPAATLLELRR